MLSAEQEKFLVYWQSNREHLASNYSKIVRGLPMALLFFLPVIMLLAAVYIFFPAWYYKVSDVTSGSIVAVVIALLLAVLFMAFFRMHFKWEMNDQLYQELKAKQQKEILNNKAELTAAPLNPETL